MDNYRSASEVMIRLGLWNQRILGALAKILGLPVPQLECLYLLYLDHPRSLGTLAQKLGIEQSTLSRLLSALEERDLIESARGRMDRRTKQVSLTLAGIIVVEQIRSKAEELALPLLETIPEERRYQFAACVSTITANAFPLERKST